MAGSTQSKRRQAAEALRREEESKRRRRLAIVAGCVVIALILVAIPVYLSLRGSGGAGLSSTGMPAAEAGCSPVAKKTATGSQQHVAQGAPIDYDQAPPASGPHYPSDAPFGRTFYTASDRPAIGNLVHNLEHGYTILWYDDSVRSDGADVAALQAIAEEFTSAKGYDPKKKFIVAPYTAGDPGSFPAGKRLALTHWSATFENGLPVNQQGITQYCEQVSGEAVANFVKDYPYTDSPEPNAA